MNNQPFAPSSSKAKTLSSLASSMPINNALTAQQVSEAAKTNMQTSIAQAVKTQAPTQEAARQLGVQAAQAEGKTRLAEQEANIQGQAKIGQEFINNAKEEASRRLQENKLANAASNYNEARRLGNLDSSLKNELFDSNLKFRKDELGRTLFNDRQLLDYKLASAKSDEELRDYEQQIEQEYARKNQILQASHAKILQAMQNEFQKSEQEADQAHRKALVLAKNAIEEKIRRQQAKAANRAAAYSAAGSIIGGVGGAILGTFVAPGVGTMAGAAAGSQLGAGVGSVASSQT